MAGFSVNIGADTNQLVTGLNNARTSLAQFNNSLAPLNRNISLTNLSFAGISNSARAAAPGINAAGSALSNIRPGANQAALALTNVGRVAQDLPFGFIGIQNNLNPLLESFQRLRAETGSNRAALKALGSSLIGAGGIGLALSVVSSAILIFGNSTRGAKKELEGFAKAIADSNKNAGEELARVQVLNAVITDNTRSQKDRTAAASNLSGVLKDLNVQMTKEEILNGNVAKATELATKAILERAQARAIESRIGELSGQQLQRDLKRTEVAAKLTKAQKDLNDQEKIRQQVIGGGTAGLSGNTIGQTNAVIRLQNQITSLDKETEKANKEIADLVGRVKGEDLNVKFDDTATKKSTDLLKQRIDALKELQSLTGLDLKQRIELSQLEVQLTKRDAVKLGFKPSEVKEKIEAQINELFPKEFLNFKVRGVFQVEPQGVKIAIPKPLTDGFKTDIAKAIGIDGKPIEVPAPPVTITGLDKELLKTMEAFKDSMKGHIGDAATVLSDALADIFTGGDIGKSLANAASGIMGIIGDILQQAGKNMILASAAVGVLTTALNNLFGPGGAVAGIAAGALLITTGALIKTIVPPQHKFATGGIVTGPVIGQIGEMHRPEVIMPLDRLPQMLRSIGGGGGNDWQLIPIINNEGLYLAVKRGERRAGRKF